MTVKFLTTANNKAVVTMLNSRSSYSVIRDSSLNRWTCNCAAYRRGNALRGVGFTCDHIVEVFKALPRSSEADNSEIYG